MHCYHGSDVKTIEQLHYETTKSFPMKPTIIYGDGDGTVNRKSLEVCLRLKDQSKGFEYKIFANRTHINLIKDNEFINHIQNLVLSFN